MSETSRGLFYQTTDIRPPWCSKGSAVFFHHGIGTNHAIWSEWVPIIAARYPVVQFDMRGFGNSIVPDQPHLWSLQEMVDDVWDVVDAAGHHRVHLVGESFGATVVLAAALARPDRVESLRMLNGTFKGQGLGELDKWEQQFAEGSSKGWSQRMMINRFHADACSPGALAWFEREQSKTLPWVAIGLGGVLAKLNLTPQLRNLKAATAIVLPDASPFISIEHGYEFVRHVKHAQLRVVAGARHGLPFSHAKTEAQALLNSLDSLN
ncbi:alpha/beta hydrolase [Polaromonas sp. YR568]|uniref:alpha/beta fold hydrolase n=1 Tax=Polaromonas sp. YR568 TaxID=1855301 RepID=UPI0031381F70